MNLPDFFIPANIGIYALLMPVIFRSACPRTIYFAIGKVNNKPYTACKDICHKSCTPYMSPLVTLFWFGGLYRSYMSAENSCTTAETEGYGKQQDNFFHSDWNLILRK